MASATITITNRSGLHARPAANFVRAAAAFPADVRVTNLTVDSERSASAKSMLGVLGLGVLCGHQVRLDASGEEAEDALEALLVLIAGGLGEGSGGE